MIEDTKTYLQRVKKYNEQINEKVVICDAARAKGSNQAERLDKELDKMIDDYVDCKKAVTNKINQLDDELQRKVLLMKYIQFLTYREIAEQLYYSISGIRRIHDDAISNLLLILHKKE